MTDTKIQWKRVDNDSNGNPRFVCHFFNLLTDEEKNAPIEIKYDLALKRAKQIGGRKFHNKQYGGGIAFVSYNLVETEAAISKLLTESK